MRSYLLVVFVWSFSFGIGLMSADQSAKVDSKPTFHIAKGLNDDGSLLKYYKRGLDYAVNYFGNYGPYHIYLFGPEHEKSVRAMFEERAMSRIDPNSKETVEDQVDEFLSRQNVVEEIKSILAGESSGGLTWTLGPIRIYEDITTNATERAKRPIENTWGAMHEYHHVFQIAHSAADQERTADKNSSSWMREGMATYSSAKFTENMGLIDFKKYMLQLRKSGGNIGRPSINEFLSNTERWQLEDETYWDGGESPQVYYMLGAWATAYLIHVQGVPEVVVLKNWYKDIPRIGKSAAFRKHMGVSLADFYKRFGVFIRQPDTAVMKIFEPLASIKLSPRR